MSGHVLDLLGAYLDGELNNSRRIKVEAHLNECSLCKSEFDGLSHISKVMQDAPAPEFMPADQFAAQVALQLPREQLSVKPVTRLSVFWWSIPLILMAAWFFLQTVITLSQIITVLNQTEVLRLSTFVGEGRQIVPIWLTMLMALLEPFYGSTSSASLSILQELTEVTREAFGQFIWQAVIAILYLGWLALVWVRRKQQGSSGKQHLS